VGAAPSSEREAGVPRDFEHFTALDQRQRRAVRYTALLVDVGCHSDGRE
jgi:hypothetical protein